jgi:hypothetical protein
MYELSVVAQWTTFVGAAKQTSPAAQQYVVVSFCDDASTHASAPASLPPGAPFVQAWDSDGYPQKGAIGTHAGAGGQQNIVGKPWSVGTGVHAGSGGDVADGVQS